MCIIIVKPAGVDFPSDEIMKECWKANKDGFGAMWRRPEDGKIQINKGYMTIETVMDWKNRHAPLLKDADVVMHFRYATHGNNTAGNTHPFPITDNVDDLRQLDYICDRAIAHNGVLQKFGKQGSSLSDTMIFVKHLSRMSISSFVGSAISRQYGKFVYMNATDTIMFGEFNEDSDIFYSNYGWKPVVTTTYVNSFRENDGDGVMVDCDGDCLRCLRTDNCVWTKECDLKCEECKFPSCIHDISAKSYNDWKKEQEKDEAPTVEATVKAAEAEEEARKEAIEDFMRCGC